MSSEQPSSLLAAGLYDRPRPPLAAFIALQHVLAMIGGIATAPLLIALGLGLGAEDTAYLIASALTVSGAATLVQVCRIGHIGSGLLSVQGTSFTFIGPIIYAHDIATESMSSAEALGGIFGAAAVLSVAMIVLSQFIERLRNVVTANVAGVTVLLLGLTLVWTTLANLYREASSAEAERELVIALATLVFVTIAALARSRKPWLRLCSVLAGLSLGMLVAGALGQIDTHALQDLPALFVPEFARWPLSINIDALIILAPIFIVSATESIGDLSATAKLSGIHTGSDDYWRRLRGGITAGGVNSLLASLLSTFPNTTFSQNNGVIRLTGVASRYVGLYVAAILVLLGLSPVVAGLFQIMPGAVLYGATLLLFLMVAYAGYRLLVDHGAGRRDWIIVGVAIAGGLLLGRYGNTLDGLPESVINVISFPVSSGAFIAMLLEVTLPQSKETAR